MKKFWGILLLLLFVFYYAGTTSFTHIHFDGNKYVTHSHPYSGNSSQPGHTHSQHQFSTISLLSLFQAFLVAWTALNSMAFRSLEGLAAKYRVRHYIFSPFSHFSLRAPPVLPYQAL